MSASTISTKEQVYRAATKRRWKHNGDDHQRLGVRGVIDNMISRHVASLIAVDIMDSCATVGDARTTFVDVA
ncbi:unnamed protein product [Arctogadus glacialis]